MITKADAVNIGVAIISGALKEKDNNYNGDIESWAISGAMVRTLGNIWFDVFTSSTRSKFNWDYNAWYLLCESKAKNATKDCLQC
jgi:hypothetical protein